jgi:hypothetical protein
VMNAPMANRTSGGTRAGIPTAGPTGFAIALTFRSPVAYPRAGAAPASSRHGAGSRAPTPGPGSYSRCGRRARRTRSGRPAPMAATRPTTGRGGSA